MASRFKMRSVLARKVKEQNGRCFYCERPFVKRHDSDCRPTRDHVDPRSNGGREDDRNIVAACWRCNNAKGDRTVYEFAMAYSYLIPALKERFLVIWLNGGNAES